MAIANGMVSYMPPKNLRHFESDLAFLPSFFASKGDIILTPNLPNPAFLEQWYALGLVKIRYLSSLKQTNSNLNYIRPWSWNPAIHHKTKHLKANTSDDFKTSPNFSWKDSSMAFFSRDTTNKVQKYIHESDVINPIINIPSPAISLTSLEDFNSWMSKQKTAILKMPWSSSGRGIHVIAPHKNLHANYPWIKGAIKQQGFLTAEPLLDKVFDFSFQLEIKQDGEIDFLGISYFINDEKGHFVGGNINWPHQINEISNFLQVDLLKNVSLILIEALKTVSPHDYYEGPIGVDAILYKDIKGNLKIHPCVDINWRYNMGIVNISLPKFVDENAIGFWKVSSFRKGEWNKFIESNKKTKPLITSAFNKISSGFINMTPANEQAAFGVWMEVWPK